MREATEKINRELKNSSVFLGLFIVTVFAGGTVGVAARAADQEMEKLASEIRWYVIGEAAKPSREKPPRQIAKGLYLTASSANNPKKLAEIIDLLNRTELNTVVIDIKDYTGNVLFDSQITLVKDLNLKKNAFTDLAATIQKLHDNNIYVIARQTVFQDPILAGQKPEWAIKSKRGGLWHDHKGLAWVDPTKKEVWKYNAALAKEAADFGFDEINFDYVRFASDGNMNDVVYEIKDKKRYEVMGEFFRFLSKALDKKPVWISLDMFGFAMERTGENDMNIGQRLVDALDVVDYISPMMYPSHYPSGHLGLANPAAFPGLVIENGMIQGGPFFADARAEVRPWIQAFNIGAVYDAAKIRAQIDAVEKYPNAGWLLWNAANRYSDAGLFPDERLAGPKEMPIIARPTTTSG